MVKCVKHVGASFLQQIKSLVHIIFGVNIKDFCTQHEQPQTMQLHKANSTKIVISVTIRCCSIYKLNTFLQLQIVEPNVNFQQVLLIPLHLSLTHSFKQIYETQQWELNHRLVFCVASNGDRFVAALPSDNDPHPCGRCHMHVRYCVTACVYMCLRVHI